jgi:hypothetical protein
MIPFGPKYYIGIWLQFGAVSSLERLYLTLAYSGGTQVLIFDMDTGTTDNDIIYL